MTPPAASGTRLPRAASGALLGALLACAEAHGTVDPLSGNPSLFRWSLPAGVAPPPVPVGNPMSTAKVELGRRLFYDTRLSGNGAFSCSSCHRQEFGFADAKNIPLGSTGQAHTRNSMGLTNVAYQRTLGWADPATLSLETQALIPQLGELPVELGIKGREGEVLQRLRSEPMYQSLFPKSFGDTPDPLTLANVNRALAAFQRTLLSFNAPFDRFARGDTLAISAAARRGQIAFSTLRCSRCHAGPNFSTALEPGIPAGEEFANTGLYNVGGTGAYPTRNGGLFEHTRLSTDMGRMKVPTLRNVAVSFPYGHDGSVGSLETVIDNYARGGRLVPAGPNAGDGRLNPFKDRRISGFAITPQGRADLVAFLQALTDSAFLTDRRFSNPWR
jgi:cytochrome c peroxidase